MNGILIAVIIISGTGLLAGVLLTLASVLFRVDVSENERKILDILPGANCGACTYAGCSEYAKLLAAGGAPGNLCPVGGQKVVREIAAILGTEEDTVKKKTAFVHCTGNIMNAPNRMDYRGLNTCYACKNTCGGIKSCVFGCDGYGDCIRACKFDAINIINGVAVVDCIKCVSCGKCIDACPKSLISFVQVGSYVKIACRSHDRGADTRRSCKAGCIACGKCKKACPAGAIEIIDNLAVIDREKCTGCLKCAGECPTGCIKIN